jgi:hypothetical protein
MNKNLLPWSISRLGMYERCPASAAYRHIQGIYTPQAPAASRGSDIHGSVERFLLRKQKFVHPAVKEYLPLLTKVRNATPHVEHRLAVDEGWNPTDWHDCWGRSVIDANTEEGNTLVIWEWKSGKIYDDHKEQRKAYITFAHAHWPEHDYYEVRTVYFDQRKRHKLKVKPKQIKIYRDQFEERVGLMSVDNMYSPRPGWYCRWCGYSKYLGGPCRAG